MKLKTPFLFVLFLTLLFSLECKGDLIGLGVGNSLTGTFIQLNRLQNLSSSGGSEPARYEYHIRANSSLGNFIENPFLPTDPVSSFGPYSSAIANNKLDFVTIQPFYGRTIRQEIDSTVSLIQTLRSNPLNVDSRVLIYQTWPSLQPGQDYSSVWNQKGLTLDSLFEPSKLTYELFGAELTARGHAFDVIPAGHVMAELSRQLAMGVNVPGISSVQDLYGDSIHLANNGSYLANLTAYTAIYEKSPAGLPYSDDAFGNPAFGTPLAPAAVPYMQELVLNVVGVPEPSSFVLLLLGCGAGTVGRFRRKRNPTSVET